MQKIIRAFQAWRDHRLLRHSWDLQEVLGTLSQVLGSAQHSPYLAGPAAAGRLQGRGGDNVPMSPSSTGPAGQPEPGGPTAVYNSQPAGFSWGFFLFFFLARAPLFLQVLSSTDTNQQRPCKRDAQHTPPRIKPLLFTLAPGRHCRIPVPEEPTQFSRAPGKLCHQGLSPQGWAQPLGEYPDIFHTNREFLEFISLL